MSKFKSHEQFLQEVYELVGNEYTVLGKYQKSNIKIKMKHNVCNREYEVAPTHFLNGSRCLHCLGHRISEKKKYTHDNFVNKVYELVGNEYIVLSNYTSSKNKVKMKHNICNHEYYVTPAKFLYGRRCPECARKNHIKTNEHFIKEVYDLVGSEYIFLEDYKDSKTKIKVRHNECGTEYKVKPNAFLSKGDRCPYCNGIKKSPERFLKEVYELEGENYTVLETYIDWNTKIKFKHNSCKTIFEMTPHIFLIGVRCPVCTKENTIKKLRKTHEEFVKEVYDLVGDEYTILGTYTRTNDKLKIRHNCDECENYEYEVTPNGFLGGNRCPKCQGTYKRSHSDFLHDIEKIHGIDAYEFLTEFVNLQTKIKVKHIKCGNVWDIAPSTLLDKNKNYQPCPFCCKSKGEIRVTKWLEENNIEFIPQMEFEGLIGTGGGNLSYDFYLTKLNILIEYQGEFHDGTVHHQSQEEFLKQLEHDRRKRNYANDNSIILLEIWYWDFDNIEEILEKFIL